MGHINEWMLHALRESATSLNCPLQWLEIDRFSWTPLVMRTLSFIVGGGTLLLGVDSKREWLRRYILSNINNQEFQRPFVPIYAFDESLVELLKASEGEAVRDILDLSYTSYAMWYIGKGDTVVARFALDTRDSFLWIFDEPLEHSFTLSSTDKHLDFKLLQAFRVFEKALFAGICGEFDLDLE